MFGGSGVSQLGRSLGVSAARDRGPGRSIYVPMAKRALEERKARPRRSSSAGARVRDAAPVRVAARVGVLVALAALAVLPSSCAKSPATAAARATVDPADAALTGRLDASLDAALREHRVVGAVLLVARDGTLVYRRAVGLADREIGRPMADDALFRYASVTKPFVAAAALVLVERRILGLEDPVTRFLPDFRPRLPDGEAPTITVRHLLTHTSGLGYTFTEPEGGPYHRGGVSDGLDAQSGGFDDNARRLAAAPLRSAPGTAFHYSLSTDVLGEIVARAHGTTLPVAVEELVTKPLGLREASFVVRDLRRLVTPYADAPGQPVRMSDGHALAFGASAVIMDPSRALDPRSYPSGGAGMVGTAGEALALLEAFRQGKLPGLSPDAARRALEDQLGDADAAELGAGVRFGFLGAVIADPSRAKSAAPRGAVRWGGVYGHSWLVDPAARISVVLMTNTTLEGMAGKLSRDVEEAIYAREALSRP